MARSDPAVATWRANDSETVSYVLVLALAEFNFRSTVGHRSAVTAASPAGRAAMAAGTCGRRPFGRGSGSGSVQLPTTAPSLWRADGKVLDSCSLHDRGVKLLESRRLAPVQAERLQRFQRHQRQSNGSRAPFPQRGRLSRLLQGFWLSRPPRRDPHASASHHDLTLISTSRTADLPDTHPVSLQRSTCSIRRSSPLFLSPTVQPCQVPAPEAHGPYPDHRGRYPILWFPSAGFFKG